MAICDNIIHAAVKELIRRYTDARVGMGTKMQMKALTVLKTACERLAPDKGVLTTAHPAFLKLCLLSNNFHLAERLMQVPIYAVDKESTGIDVEDYLTYWYYAGIVQSALKQFRKAQNSFLQVFIDLSGGWWAKCNVKFALFVLWVCLPVFIRSMWALPCCGHCTTRLLCLFRVCSA